MITILLVTAALAAPEGYKVSKEGDGCKYYTGPVTADGIVPIRAECHWPDIKLEVADKVLTNWNEHDNVFGTVDVSETVRQDGARALVHQTHVTKGISPRDVMMWGTKTPINGGFKYAWNKADGEPLTLPDGHVATAHHEGFWQVTPAADGGVDVVHELIYDPGGSVPGFLIRWFQTSGLIGTVTDLHTYLAAR